MRRTLGGERGQTAAEYMGLLLVVGVLVAAVLSSGIAGSVRSGIARAVCGIGGSCAVDKPSSAPVSDAAMSRPRDPGDPDGDGIPDAAERAAGLNPAAFDSDGDGYGDGEEAKAGTDPARADTDGDGISDGDELGSGRTPGSIKTDPFSADSDGDGLSDGEEVAIGTNPSREESDPYGGSPGDGLTDGEEVARGSDPLSHDTDGDGTWDADDDTPTKDTRSDLHKFLSGAGNIVLDDPTILIPGGGIVKLGAKGIAKGTRAARDATKAYRAIRGAKDAEEAARIRKAIVARMRARRAAAEKPGTDVVRRPAGSGSRRAQTRAERRARSSDGPRVPRRPDPDRDLAIGRTEDLGDDLLRANEQTLARPHYLPYKGGGAPQVKQNLGQLRDYARSSHFRPIRDASPGKPVDRLVRKADGTYEKRRGVYLELERRELRKLGYRYDDKTHFWKHPDGPAPSP